MKHLKFMAMILAVITFTALPIRAADTPGEHAPGKITRAVATVGEDGLQRLEVTGGEYYFEPNYLVVKVNVPVELKFKKAKGFIPHNLIVKAPEAGIDLKIDMKNDFQSIKFTPNKIGKYPMYCDKSLLWMANHKEKGMEGVIEVVE